MTIEEMLVTVEAQIEACRMLEYNDLKTVSKPLFWGSTERGSTYEVEWSGELFGLLHITRKALRMVQKYQDKIPDDIVAVSIKVK